MDIKNSYLIIATIIIVYIIAQAIYTGYFFWRSGSFIKITYLGKKELGDSKNPKFKLFVGGDSVGAGVGASAFEKSVSGRVADFYSQKYFVQFQNNSVVGYQMKDLVNKPILSDKQNLILLVISSNDLFHFTNLDRFKKSAEKVLAEYSSHTDKLILIGPGRVFDTAAIPFFIKPFYRIAGPKYANIIENEAKKYLNVVYIDPLDVSVPRSKYGSTDATDGFHPNDEGHRFWFDLIKPHL